MTPFVRATGPLAYGTGGLNVPLPSGYEVDDILVLIINTAYGEAISAVGWVHAPDSPSDSGSGGCRLNVLWRRATGSESAITTDSGDHQVARIVAIGGTQDTGSPWDVTNKGFTGTTTDITIPGDTTTAVNGLALVAAAVAQDLDQDGFISGWTNADLTSITERFDSVKDVGTGGGIALITGVRSPGPGPTRIGVWPTRWPVIRVARKVIALRRRFHPRNLTNRLMSSRTITLALERGSSTHLNLTPMTGTRYRTTSHGS